MLGTELIENLRLLTNDLSYDSYLELQRAYEEICEVSNPYWLRKTEEGLLTFTANTNVYYADISDFRSLLNIWVYGQIDGKTRWRLLTESTELTFEGKRASASTATGSDQTDMPMYYKLEDAPVTKITITPTPDSTYTTRIEYMCYPPEIRPDTEPVIPRSYHRKIAELAAGFVLIKSGDPLKINLGNTYIQEARRAYRRLFRDSSPNRTGKLQPNQIEFRR